MRTAQSGAGKIRSDRNALFSDFKDHSPSETVTVRGDLPWLMEKIMAAYRQALQAADFLNFDLAELAQELNQASASKAHEADDQQPQVADGIALTQCHHLSRSFRMATNARRTAIGTGR